jgi:hypothetical protein
MNCNSHEVFIGGEQRKSLLAACRCNQKIDRAGVDSLSTADRS